MHHLLVDQSTLSRAPFFLKMQGIFDFMGSQGPHFFFKLEALEEKALNSCGVAYACWDVEEGSAVWQQLIR